MICIYVILQILFKLISKDDIIPQYQLNVIIAYNPILILYYIYECEQKLILFKSRCWAWNVLQFLVPFFTFKQLLMGATAVQIRYSAQKAMPARYECVASIHTFAHFWLFETTRVFMGAYNQITWAWKFQFNYLEMNLCLTFCSTLYIATH